MKLDMMVVRIVMYITLVVLGVIGFSWAVKGKRSVRPYQVTIMTFSLVVVTGTTAALGLFTHNSFYLFSSLAWAAFAGVFLHYKITNKL